HGLLARWKGQTRLAGAWSVGPMEGSKRVGGRRGPLDRWKGVRRPAPLALVGGGAPCPAPGAENSRDGLGTTRRYVLSGLNCLFLDQSESQPALVVFTRPQPQVPNFLGATGTGPPIGLAGPWPVKNQLIQLKTNLSMPCNSAEFFSERNFPSTVEQTVITEYRCL